MEKIYFASDFHLGVDAKLSSKERERQLVRWLDFVVADATAIYLVGDIFDFWFEYRSVVPKGYVRLLGKLAELVDRGIRIELFTGNHDMWIFDYFETEMGIKTHRAPITVKLGDKTFFIGHGDGLGPGDKGYKVLKKIFANKLCQWLFARIHPNFGIGLANFWSGRSRYANVEAPYWLGNDQEWLYQYSERKLQSVSADYYIFGHRHLTIDAQLSNGQSRYVNLGEWLFSCSYAVFDGADLQVKFFENEAGKIWGAE